MQAITNGKIATLLASVSDEELKEYMLNFLEAVTHAKTTLPILTEAQADSLLDLTYQYYLGRPLDDNGRNQFLPWIRKAGFEGLLMVIGSMLGFHQPETNERVRDTLDNLAGELGYSQIQHDPYCDLAVRFFGEHGRAWIGQLSQTVPQIEEWKRQAKSWLDRNPAKALELLDQVITIPWPSSWDTWHDHGLALYRLEWYLEAISSYQRSIELNDESSWMWSCEDLKFCYDRSGTHQEGWYYFDGLSKRRPDWWIVWHERGFMAWKTRKLDEAVLSYSRAIELYRDPTWRWSSEDLKNCLFETGTP